MGSLVSPGVSVTVTDESFFIPAGAPTVPMFFLATGDEKTQSDGTTPAAGTFESGVIRTVTSQKVALELYGTPVFLEDSAGNRHDGDARNEYGLAALQQFLNQGSLAYVVRANVNLSDDIDEIRDLWDRKITEAAFVLEAAADNYLTEQNATDQTFPGDEFVNAFWTADYEPDVSLGDNTGLAGGETATLTIDGTDYFLVAPAPGAGSPIGILSVKELLVYINQVIGTAGTASLTGSPSGDIQIRSAATQGSGASPSADAGVSTDVQVVDTGSPGLFSSMTNYVSATATPGVNGYKETLNSNEYLSLLNSAMTEIVYSISSFQSVEDSFEDDQSLDPFGVFPNGFDQPESGTEYHGVEGRSGVLPNPLDPDPTDTNTNAATTTVGPNDDGLGLTSGLGGSNPEFQQNWTSVDAADDLVAAADDYKYTQEFFNLTSLGENDEARRTTIVSALNAEIVGNEDVRSENYEYNIIICPGYWETNNEMVDLAKSKYIKEEAVVIGDTPSNQTPSETTQWAQSTERASSNLIAYYYPWQLITNVDGSTICVAPSGTALKTWAFSDAVSQVWFAPAGTRRGFVTGVEQLGYVSGTLGNPTTFVPTYVDQGQRDDLYRYFVNVNPIVFFPGRGILLWGQKTSAPDASALDRINVTRLMAYIRRNLRKGTLSYVFEPNDQLTRDNLKATVDAFLSDIVVKRGLFDFATISDSSNNTPDRIDRNEMYIDVALKPVKAAEFIYIPIRIVSTDAEI